MSRFQSALRFLQLQNAAASARGTVNVSGISESRVAPVAALLFELLEKQCLILTSNYEKAKKLAGDLSFFAEAPVYCLPEEDSLHFHYDAKSREGMRKRLKVMEALSSGQRCIVVLPASAAVKPLSPPALFQQNRILLASGEEADLEELKKELVHLGYERMSVAEAPGQFALRGGILDVFPPGEDHPFRVEFFDTEIDSIRTFHPESQRSLEMLDEAVIYPASPFLIEGEEAAAQAESRIRKAYGDFAKKLDEEKKARAESLRDQLLEALETGSNLPLLENYIHYFYEEPSFLWDYLEKDAFVMVDDPERVRDILALRDKEGMEDFKVLMERGEAAPADQNLFVSEPFLSGIYKNRRAFVFTPFQKQIRGIDSLDASINIVSKQPPVFNGRMDFLETELKRYVKLKYQVLLVCSTEERRENLQNFVDRLDLTGRVFVETGELSGGMEFPEEKWVVLSDKDIFVTTKRKRVKSSAEGAPIKAFTDIRKGDFVVHESHGIGKFEGVEALTVQGVRSDYLKVRYAGEDMLYIPVDQMDLIQKYVGAEGIAPRINKLSGGEWKKTRARTKAAIKDMAAELLALSAARKTESGYAFPEDSLWQKEFEDLFPYEETDDQLRCVKEIKRDMEKAYPMDRLLCGDVGYGKTEVAARAVFKCIAEGKQAALLVPTTLLANQHYYTFKERLKDFPFNVEMLCRFRTEKQQEAIIDKLNKGEIDLVVGTHRLLSKDVKFKDLGLLVIDEEQRFGVQHKESIKQLRKSVDVLALSATPIPRTLHMSLIGIRDMSIIEEPPEERYPVQTYVLEQDSEMMAEAIRRELDRGGQVYVVYNRVRGIQKIAAQIREMVPEASVVTAHGQMNERTLEDIMVDFVNGEYNVLVATTIIESGIDIPNANTLIILEADHFGLSQLYQIRGRVGRSNRMAYAYLLYQKDKVLSETAEKRLRAIREFTEFGSGFRIAMRDLEIRGAGNLLGTEQSGHMMQVGYELYCKMVDDAVKELSGEPVREEGPETSIEMDVEAYIPEEYIPDEFQKLDMYKKIASIRTQEDWEEVMDELMDRFGTPPKATMNLTQVALIRGLAEKGGISRIHREQGKTIYDFHQASSLTAPKAMEMVSIYGSRLLIYGGSKPYMKYSGEDRNRLKDTLEFLTNFVK